MRSKPKDNLFDGLKEFPVKAARFNFLEFSIRRKQYGIQMGFLKNILINVKAKGPAAVVIVWFICITALGILGDGENAKYALFALYFGGMIIFGALLQK